MAQKKKLSNNKKRKVKVLLEQAKQAFAAQQLDVCEQLCRKINAIWPDNPDVSNMRGVRAAAEGRNEEAEVFFVQAANAAPKRVEFRNNLGKLYLQSRLYADAAEIYGQAWGIDRQSLVAQLGYYNAQIKLNHADKVLRSMLDVVKRFPNNPDVLITLFRACYALNRIEEAREYVQRILDRHPDHIEAQLYLGQVVLQQGDFTQAEAAAHAALRLDPKNIPAYTALAVVKRFKDTEDPDISAMAQLFEQGVGSVGEQVDLGFALGKALDDCKDYDRAFEYFKKVNDIRHEQYHYNADEELAHMQEIMSYFTGEACARTSGIEDETPIFILGMPRCGSTLTEQIIAAHPDVLSRGEGETFVKYALLDYHSEEKQLTLDQLTSFSPEQWHKVGTTYLQRLKADTSDTLRITDKSLTNIRHIGSIHCALPHARIIHVRRNPLDTCLSIYKNDLLGAQFHYGRNLGELGYYYRMYQRLMQHWQDVLPAGVMYELDYEKLVENQESETRKLLAFCGLDWDESCLHFNRTRNIVSTSSIAQVRRPIYRASMSAWKRYEKHLQPLIRILGTG